MVKQGQVNDNQYLSIYDGDDVDRMVRSKIVIIEPGFIINEDTKVDLDKILSEKKYYPSTTPEDKLIIIQGESTQDQTGGESTQDQTGGESTQDLLVHARQGRWYYAGRGQKSPAGDVADVSTNYSSSSLYLASITVEPKPDGAKNKTYKFLQANCTQVEGEPALTMSLNFII